MACISRGIAALACMVVACVSGITAWANEDCHPAVDAAKPQFVIGYGSLMETESKRRTAPDTGSNLPVLVTGFARSWNTRGSEVGFSTTYLGADVDASAEMVAALYRVFRVEDIKATDDRESFYCRVAVAADAARMLDGSEVPHTGQIWIYVNKPDAVDLPDERFPIVQSYVDIFMTGCLQLEEKVHGWNRKFSEECIATTRDWSPHWVNDRLYPRRAFIYQPNAYAIDTLLQKLVPKEFAAVRIE